MQQNPVIYDAIIIGGGPAGLTAAIYLARFRRSVCVLDAGKGRAEKIPMSHNHAGFPGGIAGSELLDRMRQQAMQYGSVLASTKVMTVNLHKNVFETHGSDGKIWRSQSLILATGVINHQPEMNQNDHNEALARGLLRYCPVCDGFEVIDQCIGVLARDSHSVDEALFVRTYTDDITLLLGNFIPSPSELSCLEAASIKVEDRKIEKITLGVQSLDITFCDGAIAKFDSVYPALGSTAQSELAKMLGIDCTEDGCIKVSAHQRTSVRSVYAIGDVVIGLDQISAAMGQGAVAATDLHNYLRKPDNWKPQG